MAFVMVMPSGVTSASVTVGGVKVGEVAEVTASAPFTGFDGQTHVGARWLPVGLPTDLEGPVTRNEAVLLLVVLEGALRPEEAAKALGFGVPTKTRMSA